MMEASQFLSKEKNLLQGATLHDFAEQRALNQHIQAIAKILCEATSPEQLTTLGGIEASVFSQELSECLTL